ncbi:PREDICTED: uncharacterized protein LOC108616756 [Drosophila arizonae]|uniref:Uncharacterized protein LOC108616756 n=1 Tax=Drosophila arizonae TaxID=7263 RepID=A0ABM1PKD0_DROAR|nr:PREDICTED: uncharacterized protein LOC108616756 [Drosophila arizonae]
MDIPSVLSWIFVILWLSTSCSGKRNWDAETLFVNSSTSDESLLEYTTEIVRQGREKPTFSAVLDFHYQLDDTTTVEVLIYHSQTGGEDDYKLMPWNVPQKPFSEFIGEYYKDLLYANLGSCSNLAEPGKEIPWPKITYKFEKCQITGDGMPEIAPEGYYKIFFTATGPVDWSFVYGMKIVSKSNAMGY